VPEYLLLRLWQLPVGPQQLIVGTTVTHRLPGVPVTELEEPACEGRVQTLLPLVAVPLRRQALHQKQQAVPDGPGLRPAGHGGLSGGGYRLLAQLERETLVGYAQTGVVTQGRGVPGAKHLHRMRSGRRAESQVRHQLRVGRPGHAVRISV
jgi:hypothetical protein